VWSRRIDDEMTRVWNIIQYPYTCTHEKRGARYVGWRGALACTSRGDATFVVAKLRRKNSQRCVREPCERKDGSRDGVYDLDRWSHVCGRCEIGQSWFAIWVVCHGTHV